MQTYQQFAKKHNVTLEARHKGQRTEKMGDHKVNQDIWACTLLHNGAAYDFPFYVGVGQKGKTPTVDEVLYCLASDAQSTDESFEDWCGNLGYDSDSRKALATYEACARCATELERLLGQGPYNDLIHNTNEEGDE